MDATLQYLLGLLDLERIEEDIFRGASHPWVAPRVFGGQVAAQALVAASRTVPADRPPHSLHSYFLRPGDPGAPIVYTVDRIRDGHSFTTRRAVAVQHGQAIFHLSASYQTEEPGLEHQEPMPEAPDPETLPAAEEMLPRYQHLFADPAAAELLLETRRMIDMRYVAEPPFATAGQRREPRNQVWFRLAAKLDGEHDRPLLHTCLGTYVSDMTLLDSILLAHGRGGWMTGDIVGASLDHAMWFHRPFRVDEWLLYDTSSPTSQGGRGLAHGRIFTRDGKLAVSVVQEGLMRVPRAERRKMKGL